MSTPPARRYVIWGSAGHAKVLAGLVALRRGEVVALFDRLEVPAALAEVPLYVGEAGFDAWADQERFLTEVSGLVAIGGHRGRDRLAVHSLFRRRRMRIESLVHPDASVCDTAVLGAGTQVLAQAVVAAEASIGEGCIINHRAAVDHECRLGDGVHIAPGATLCGCVDVGDNVMVGAGAVVLPRLTIGNDCIVGAGAVVTRDVPPGCVVAGNPARLVRRHHG